MQNESIMESQQRTKMSNRTSNPLFVILLIRWYERSDFVFPKLQLSNYRLSTSCCQIKPSMGILCIWRLEKNFDTFKSLIKHYPLIGAERNSCYFFVVDDMTRPEEILGSDIYFSIHDGAMEFGFFNFILNCFNVASNPCWLPEK